MRAIAGKSDRYLHSGTANSLFRNILPLKPLLLIFCGPTRGLLGRKANEMKILQIRSKNCRTRISTLATSLLHSSVCRRDVARNVSMHLKELFMRRLLLSLLVFAFALPALTQAKHPFTFDDMMKLKRVGDPQVSPDGKWVIFSVVDVDLAANTKTPHIWIVPLDAHVGTAAPGRPAEQSSAGSSSAERILIADQDADRPRWAPDGKRFAFLSNKEGGSQVWIAEFDGTEEKVTSVYRLTSIATEASGELWSPNGKDILFTSDVYPECDGEPLAESECNAKRLKESEQSKIKAQIFTHLLYRHWNAYKEGKRTHLFVTGECTLVVPPKVYAPSAGQPAKNEHGVTSRGQTAQAGCANAPLDLTPGDYDAPVFSLGGQDDYAFSPDGQEICYASNHDKNPAASTNNDLWIVRVGTGDSPVQAKNITADNPASDSTPLYSPDGRYIAYRSQQRPGYESDRFRLMLYDRKTGEKNDLTEDFDHWVGSFVWAPDSKAIYFSAEHKRHSLIYAVGTARAAGTDRTPTEYLRRTLVGGFDDDVAVTPDGKKLFFTRMSIAAPNELYAADASGEGCPARTGDVDHGKENCSLNKDWPISHINDQLLSQIGMSDGEPFSFTGAHGDWVEGFLVKS